VTRTTVTAAASLILLAGGLAAAPADDAAKEAELLRARLAALAAQQKARAAQPIAPGVRLNDGFDAVLLTPARPVRVRVSVLFNGKPVAEAWRAALRAAFDYFDRDRDGFLSAKEVENVFSDRGLAGLLGSGFLQPTPQDAPTLEKLDTDGDGRVSFDEFAAYYKTAAGMVLRAVPVAPENPTNTQLTEALFKLFDKDGDGKLTRAELADVERLLATADADEDECLSINELLPGRGGAQQRVVPVLNTGTRPAPRVPDNFLLYEPGRIPGTVTQRVITKYDKDGDYELTREECGFDEETFRRLDTDGDGKLSGEELDAWRTGPADLEVLLSVAPRPQDCTAKLTTDPTTAAARGLTPRQGSPGRLIVRVGRQPVEFSATLAGNRYDAAAARGRSKEALFGLFAAAAGAKDYVEEKDLSGPNAPRFQALRVQFDPADANGDGKLTREELEHFLDLQQSFADLGLVAAPAVQMPTLFQLLDENRDGRLSRRELRTAWDRLIALEAPGAEAVTREVIQPTMTVQLVRSVDRAAANEPFAAPVAVTARTSRPPAGPPPRGPAWFRKMDRNGDGDVSRAEFLGTKAEFDAIDTDGDGLISIEEAEAYDQKVRKAEEKK
jgi:Ca2+-binding EF-hand superfamily protein